MPRAFTLIKVAFDPEAAFQVLSQTRFDASFVRDTRAVLECVHWSFGAAHFSTLMFAATIDALYHGLRELRQRLDRKLPRSPEPHYTLTSTVLGLSPDEVRVPAVLASASDEIVARIKALGGLSAPDDMATSVALGRVAAENYIRERLRFLKEFIGRSIGAELLNAAIYGVFLTNIQTLLTATEPTRRE